MRIRNVKNLARWLVIIAGGIVVTVAGLACLSFSFAEPLTRLSYDLPFLWRATLDTHEVALVYLDDEAAKQLHQPLDDVWNRALHTRLLDRLTQDKARLVFYDIVFDLPAPDPASDAAFAESLQRHGKAILGASFDTAQSMGTVKQQRVSAPLKLLRKAAAGWGLLDFQPVDPDYGVRQLFTGTADFPSATWKAAEVLGANVTSQPRALTARRWINYYGPRNTFSSVNFAQALDPEGVPPGYFQDKIVLVGGRSAVGYLATRRDDFATPYSRSNHQFSPGLEVHATILLNLLRGEWLTRMPPKWETALVVLVGLLAAGLAALRPGLAAIVAIGVSLATTCFAWWFAWHERVWFDWLIPAAIQMPLGLVWSLGSQYLLESRRQKELRRAFGFYLSPHMADKIANSDFDLTPGGKIVDVTVVFTDLEGFTTLSEHMDPKELSEVLTAYFGQTTRCILENNGTIIKYIGDAVFAAWGAPVDEPAHAIRAAEAACDLRCLTELEVRGNKLRTRVGIHSGKVLAGNLGSSFRFDYTMIGDAVNFASRLESINKYLSTQILISDAVRERLGDKFITRRLGEFRVAGKTQSVVIHELLCRCNSESGEKNWIEPFETGLRAFRSAEFREARDSMNRTRQMRGGFDGPAEFYLKKIETAEANGQAGEWTGIVELAEK
jgi:adenylate cyclase